MGVHLNKKTGNYYIRVEHYGRDHEKVIGRISALLSWHWLR
jgi:hypothetical protein